MEDEVMDGLPDAVAVSPETVEQLEVWIKTHPKGLADAETLPGHMVIIAEAILRDRRANCWRLIRKLGECRQ